MAQIRLEALGATAPPDGYRDSDDWDGWNPVTDSRPYLFRTAPTYESIGPRHGIALASGSSRGTVKDEDGNNKGYTSIAYLGLLKSSMFIYGRSYYDFDTSRIRYWRASIGKSPQTNPVSGTWSGLALGEIQQRYEPVYRKMVEGSVQVNVRLDGSDTLATVAFGNWKFLDRNERTEYPFPTSGPTFENVSVTKGGFVTDDVEMFRAAGGWVHQAISGDSTSVSGRFYGDNHGEVGGAFTLHSGLRSRACDPPFDVCDRLRGVFGAKRP